MWSSHGYKKGHETLTLTTKYSSSTSSISSTYLEVGPALLAIFARSDLREASSDPITFLAMKFTSAPLLLSTLLSWCYGAQAKAVFAHFMVGLASG